jgi:hypothetical protein
LSHDPKPIPGKTAPPKISKGAVTIDRRIITKFLNIKIKILNEYQVRGMTDRTASIRRTIPVRKVAGFAAERIEERDATINQIQK